MSQIVTTEAGFLEQLKVFEGFARHMYLDTRANVTIGTGLAATIGEAIDLDNLYRVDRLHRFGRLTDDLGEDLEQFELRMQRDILG